jgi:hypothetical protein
MKKNRDTGYIYDGKEKKSIKEAEIEQRQEEGRFQDFYISSLVMAML